MIYGIRYMENIRINIFVSKDKVFKYEDKTTIILWLWCHFYERPYQLPSTPPTVR